MTADFTGTMRPRYRVRLEVAEPVLVQHVPGSLTPASLLLALQDRPTIAPPIADVEPGATLVLDMRWEEMAALYSAIWHYGQKMDLPLPGQGDSRS